MERALGNGRAQIRRILGARGDDDLPNDSNNHNPWAEGPRGLGPSPRLPKRFDLRRNGSSLARQRSDAQWSGLALPAA